MLREILKSQCFSPLSCTNGLAKLLGKPDKMSGSQNTLSHSSQVLIKMSVKLLQFIELEQTCVEYGSSNASCFNVFYI